jgi:DNA modification methylase
MKKDNLQTKEEYRVVFYNDTIKPTVPARVTPSTRLDELNLNWREYDLPEKERTKHVHRLHPYLGKFIPQLVEVFLRKYFKPGDTVLDPFAGSSTTLVQAQELGINAYGYDISAFNVLLGRVKTAQYHLPELRYEIKDVLEKTAKTVGTTFSPQLSLWDKATGGYTETDDEYLKTWFAPQALSELLTYLAFINKGNYRYADVLKVILSRSARSSRLTTHFDLDFPKKPQTEPYHCYKHSRICQPTTDAMQFLKRYSKDTLRRIEEFSLLQSDANIQLFHGDSRTVKFPPIAGVITSPPYVGLIDYHAQHEYAYHLLGLDDNRGLEIGPAANGSSQKAKFSYQDDITIVFNHALESMPRGGRLIIVANDKSNLYEKIGNDLGIDVEAIVQRHVNRRTGRRSSEFFESIFIWQKR